MRQVAMALVLAAAIVACSSTDVPEAASAVRYYQVADAEPLRYDLVPTERPAVAVVLLHGFDDRARASMDAWAAELATLDAVTLNGDWMPAGATQEPPTELFALATPDAVACLVDTARAVTGLDRVIVVAVSAGAYQAVIAGATWNDLTRDGCEAPATGPPDVIVALAGAFDAARRGPLASALVSSGDVLERLDPFVQLSRDDPAVELAIVHGDADPIIPASVATEFADHARSAGWTVEQHVIPGGRHFEFGSPSTPEGSAAAAIVTEIVSRGR